MNKEVKEILSLLNSSSWSNEAKQIEDYITDLQNLLKLRTDCLKMNQERIDKAIDKVQYIIDYGFDYDGFNKSEDLKGLIDMLVDYARQAKTILKGEDK